MTSIEPEPETVPLTPSSSSTPPLTVLSEVEEKKSKLKHPFPDHGKDEAPCIICCKMAKTRCNKCHKYYYCSVAHQKLHWRQGFNGIKHEEECKQCGLCTSPHDLDNKQQMLDEVTAVTFYNQGLVMPENATEEEKDDLLINNALALLARPAKPKGLIADWMTKEFIVDATKEVINQMQGWRSIGFIELDKDSELQDLKQYVFNHKKEGVVMELKIKPHSCCVRPLCQETSVLHGVLLSQKELVGILNKIAKRKIDIVYYRAGTYSHMGQRCLWMDCVVKT